MPPASSQSLTIASRPTRAPTSARDAPTFPAGEEEASSRSAPGTFRTAGATLSPSTMSLVLLQRGHASTTTTCLLGPLRAGRQQMLGLPLHHERERADPLAGECREGLALLIAAHAAGRGQTRVPAQKRHRRGVPLLRHRNPAPSERAVWNNSLSRCSASARHTPIAASEPPRRPPGCPSRADAARRLCP